MNDEHSLIEFLLTVQNLSESKMTEPDGSILSRQEDRDAALQIKRFMDQIPGGFFIYRADGSEEILYVNRGVLRIFGCETVEEFQTLTNDTFRGMVHPDDFEEIEASIWEQISNSQHDLDYVEYRIIRKDETIRWVEDYWHFIHSKTMGDLFYVFLADTTEKRLNQMEERKALLNENTIRQQQLRIQAEEYNKSLEHVNDELQRRLELIGGLSINYESVFYVDLRDDLIQPYRVGSCPEYLFGKDLQVRRFSGFADEYIKIWVHPEDQEVFSRAVTSSYICQTLENQKSFYTNFRIIKDGTSKFLQIFVVNVGEKGPVSQIMIGLRSVDEELCHEMERNQLLEDALQQAKTANLARNTFLSNMSHDMRTPLNAIVGFTSLAKSHMDNPKRLQSYLDLIEHSSAQLLHLMDDILEIAWFESGTLHVEETACSLLDIARDIQETNLSLAAEKNLALSVAFTGLEHPKVFADHKKLTQVLLRLVGNSIQYTEPGGHVTVTFAEQNATQFYAAYQFIVEDTGIGINEDFIAHIFEPFEREKNTTMSGVQGAGLGLPIAKSIVDMMGGTIEASSVPGVGSTFTVSLSLRIQKEQETEVTELLSAEQNKPRRILVVEDNPINMEIAVDLLEDEGFLVDTAENGQIALEKVKASQPGDFALILMDLQMPVMDGHSAARAIRSLQNPALAEIPIIALSANTFDEDRKMSAESGMNAHMAKPIDIPRLLEMMDHMLRQAQADEE